MCNTLTGAFNSPVADVDAITSRVKSTTEADCVRVKLKSYEKPDYVSVCTAAGWNYLTLVRVHCTLIRMK